MERYQIQIKMNNRWVIYPERYSLALDRALAAFEVLKKQIDLYPFRLVNESTLNVVDIYEPIGEAV